MKALQVDALSGDLKVTSGRLVLVSRTDALMQKIAQRLRMFQGEWFLDLRAGIPYRRSVFVKNPDYQLIRSIFAQAISSTEGVKSVEAVDLTYFRKERRLQVDWKATAESGELLDTRTGNNSPLIFGLAA